jgi:hypothetical protein
MESCVAWNKKTKYKAFITPIAGTYINTYLGASAGPTITRIIITFVLTFLMTTC